MSATRDQSQKVTFVYSNLYQAYRKGVEAAKAAGAPVGLSRGKVIKSEDARRSEIRVESHRPRNLRASKPSVLKTQSEALQSLKDNMKSLTDLHSRLRFMLKELEDLVKR